MRNTKKLLLGLSPTRRFVFSAEDAARYKVLVEEKLKGWAWVGRYAVPAFNFVCLEQLLAIVYACMDTRSPFIVQCSANVRVSSRIAAYVHDRGVMARMEIARIEREGGDERPA